MCTDEPSQQLIRTCAICNAPWNIFDWERICVNATSDIGCPSRTHRPKRKFNLGSKHCGTDIPPAGSIRQWRCRILGSVQYASKTTCMPLGRAETVSICGMRVRRGLNDWFLSLRCGDSIALYGHGTISWVAELRQVCRG